MLAIPWVFAASRIHFDRSSKYFSFEIYQRRKLEEKLNYMHLNPVRAGLVARAVDWVWSSARLYELGQTVGVPIQWVD